MKTLQILNGISKHDLSQGEHSAPRVYGVRPRKAWVAVVRPYGTMFFELVGHRANTRFAPTGWVFVGAMLVIALPFTDIHFKFLGMGNP